MLCSNCAGGAAGVTGRVSQTCGGAVVAVGTVSGTDSRRAADRAGADAAPLPHQTPVLAVLRTGAGDARQRRISCGQRPGGTQTQGGVNSRTELEPQPRNEESVQSRRHHGQHARGSVARVLSRAARQRHAAGDGALDAGTQDRRHHAEDLEERRSVRRRAFKATSSLSAQSPRNAEPSLRDPSVTERSGSRVSIHAGFRRNSLTGHRMLPRTTQQSNRPRVSDRTMVGNCQHAACRRKEAARNNAELYGVGTFRWTWSLRITLRHRVLPLHTGLDVRELLPRQRREKCFLLTSPFIEPPFSSLQTSKEQCALSLLAEEGAPPPVMNSLRQA